MFPSQQTLKLCLRLTSFSCVEMFILLNFVVSVLNTRFFLLNSRRTAGHRQETLWTHCHS